MPVVEIVTYTASEALLADPTVGDKGIDYLKKMDGCLSVYRGFQLEDKTQAYIVITWETYDKYEAMTKREDFPSFIESNKPGLAGGLLIQHVEYDADATNALSAPVTEMTIAKPREGHTQEEVNLIIAQIKENAHLVPGGYPPLPWGQVKQNPGSYTIAIGWDSIEAHVEGVKVPPMNELSMKLFESADLNVKHVSFTKA